MPEAEWGASESGNWNVAANYVEGKIYKPLVLIDDYFRICKFGTTELGDEFTIPEEMSNLAKIKAIKRLNNELMILVRNTRFALRKADKEQFTSFKADLKKIKELLPFLEEKLMKNNKVVKVNINEERFEKLLGLMEDIYEKILEPLNKADLIFMNVEEYSPEQLKSEMVKRMTERG